MYLLSRSTLKQCIYEADLHQNYIFTKQIYTKTIKYQSITSNEMKNRQSFAPSPPPSHSLPLFPLSFFFRIIMTFRLNFGVI
jgi:hypothetical protein